jgi:hypothetical protein
MSLGVGGIKVQRFTTSDSVEKVTAFYQEKLGPQATVSQSSGKAVVQALGSNGAVVSVSIVADSASGNTTFTITSYGKQ